MKGLAVLGLGAGLAIGTAAAVAIAQTADTGTAELKRPSAFSSLTDERERSLALFEEAGKVIQHPRCVNCHPASDRPLQTDAMIPHMPPVQRGDGGMGVPGMRCTTCHQVENVDLIDRSMPGHAPWSLAPAEQAWEGKSLGEICAQIKDPERNGERTLADLHEHMAEDGLVGWGWHPGEGRTPAPGSQEIFGALIAAWIETGAHCPDA